MVDDVSASSHNLTGRKLVTELAQCEREFMELFRHFRCTAGHVVSAGNILAARTQYRSSSEHDKVLNAIIESLVRRGMVTVEPDDQSSLRLTAEGELHLYGEDDGWTRVPLQR